MVNYPCRLVIESAHFKKERGELVFSLLTFTAKNLAHHPTIRHDNLSIGTFSLLITRLKRPFETNE